MIMTKTTVLLLIRVMMYIYLIIICFTMDDEAVCAKSS